MFVKRYELVMSDMKFYLRYNGEYTIKKDGCLNEEYKINATNWDEAEEQAEKLIKQLKEENKRYFNNDNLIVTYG